MSTRPAVLIEDWLPFEAVGAESQRERGGAARHALRGGVLLV